MKQTILILKIRRAHIEALRENALREETITIKRNEETVTTIPVTTHGGTYRPQESLGLIDRDAWKDAKPCWL